MISEAFNKRLRGVLLHHVPLFHFIFSTWVIRHTRVKLSEVFLSVTYISQAQSSSQEKVLWPLPTVRVKLSEMKCFSHGSFSHPTLISLNVPLLKLWKVFNEAWFTLKWMHWSHNSISSIKCYHLVSISTTIQIIALSFLIWCCLFLAHQAFLEFLGFSITSGLSFSPKTSLSRKFFFRGQWLFWQQNLEF